MGGDCRGGVNVFGRCRRDDDDGGDGVEGERIAKYGCPFRQQWCRGCQTEGMVRHHVVGAVIGGLSGGGASFTVEDNERRMPASHLCAGNNNCTVRPIIIYKRVHSEFTTLHLHSPSNPRHSARQSLLEHAKQHARAHAKKNITRRHPYYQRALSEVQHPSRGVRITTCSKEKKKKKATCNKVHASSPNQWSPPRPLTAGPTARANAPPTHRPASAIKIACAQSPPRAPWIAIPPRCESRSCSPHRRPSCALRATAPAVSACQPTSSLSPPLWHPPFCLLLFFFLRIRYGYNYVDVRTVNTIIAALCRVTHPALCVQTTACIFLVWSSPWFLRLRVSIQISLPLSLSLRPRSVLTPSLDCYFLGT